jgi:hypothetical protein
MSLMMKSRIIVALILFSGFSASAQLNVEDYLSAPFQSAEITGLAEQLDFINNESFRSPLFREMELRIRSKTFDIDPDDVRLRLGFINPMERRANKNYESTQTEYLEIKYAYEANLILANRYKQLVKHFHLTEYDALLAAEVNQLMAAYEQIQLQEASFKEWVETDERILKKELEREDVSTSIEMTEHLIGEILGTEDAVYWDNFEVISVARMQDVLLPDTVLLPKKVELALKSYELEQKAYLIEKAESHSNIGYIQAEYDLQNDEAFKDGLGFQLGVSIPLFNPDKPKLQREKLDLLEQEYKVQEVKDENSLDTYKLNEKFRRNIRSYLLLTERLDKLELLSKNITYDDMEDFLAMINYHGNLRALKQESYLDCLNAYIDILALSGRLSEAPYVNYISNALSPFTFE